MTTFFGYIGDIWALSFASLRYLQSQVAAAPQAAQTEAVAQAVFQTVMNSLYAIDASRYQAAWQQESTMIGEAIGLPITYDAGAVAYLNQRSLTYANASAALQAILPEPPFGVPSVVLPRGEPVVADPGLVTFFQNFDIETPPTVYSTPDTLITSSQAAANAFQRLANQIRQFQGVYLTQAYDSLVRLQTMQQIATDRLISITSSGFSADGMASPAALWNHLAVLPPMMMDAAALSSGPASLAVQQACVIRNALITSAKALAVFLTVLHRPGATKLNLAKVNIGDTLMDIAARALGDFSRWRDIAAVNNLKPPYLGPTASDGVAAYGSDLILPTPGASVSPSGRPPSYLTDFLGVDIYIGPINQPMPPWGGDFQTISGYQNLRWALGRREQTPLGSLIYHVDYGSRLPAEVGTIQTPAEAARAAAFGKSSLLGDPRVSRVLNAQATVGANGQITFEGTVQPKGFGTRPLDLSETIGG